jgi:opacity protein-like surface antigen
LLPRWRRAILVGSVERRSTMRRIILAAVVFAAVSAASVSAFNPDELNKITFQNTTGGIEMIFLSPGDSKFWGPDIVGADYFLKDGATIGYYVHYPDKSFKFDIMATDESGNKFEVRDFEMTDGKEANVKLTAKSLDSTAPDFTLATVHIDNNTGFELQYLFVSPSDSDAWGVDLLDEETTIADGDSHSFVLAVGKEKVKYNLMAVDENDAEYKFNVTIDPKSKKDFTWSIDPADLQKTE